MPLGSLREKVLYGIGASRGRLHRYTYVRWVVGVLFTALIAALPLLGLLRFDLWGGHHMWLGEEVDFVTVAKRFAFPFLAVNIVIILVSRFLGRWLCGFVCPWGALARLAEWSRFRKRRRIGSALLRASVTLAVCVLLVAITFSFWVDWRVFRDGSAVAIALSAGFLVGGTALLFGGITWVGLRFCREWCPSGVYFAVLGPETNTGIEFARPDNCTECKACEKVCPMDLMPTKAEPCDERLSGFYPDGTDFHAACIRCGDCVAACESTTGLSDGTPLRMGPLQEVGAGAHREHGEHGGHGVQAQPSDEDAL